MVNRREFMLAIAGSMLSAMPKRGGNSRSKILKQTLGNKKSKISLVKTSNRAVGIQRVTGLLEINPVKGQDVFLKPNFNTADPFPGSTHNDTLSNLILCLKKMGAKSITIGERSGPAGTNSVIKEKGIKEICKEHDVGLINFEELSSDSWVKIKPGKSHWRNGFYVAKPILDSKCTVATCCLKTHGFGGVFTMSLKLSVGITHKKNMTELHTSPLSMRKMIAEINQAYAPSPILLDGLEAFVDGGPMNGTRKKADVILAGTDRGCNRCSWTGCIERDWKQ